MDKMLRLGRMPNAMTVRKSTIEHDFGTLKRSGQAVGKPQSAGSDVDLGEESAVVVFELRSNASIPICTSDGAMSGRVGNDDCKRASVP